MAIHRDSCSGRYYNDPLDELDPNSEEYSLWNVLDEEDRREYIDGKGHRG